MRLLLFAPLLLCACTGTPRDPYLSRGGIPVVSFDSDTNAGEYHPDTRTIKLDPRHYGYVLAHELCHAADSTGLPYGECLRLLSEDPRAKEIRGYAIAVRVGTDAAKLHEPLAHWVALGRICGPQAIWHMEVLDQVRHRL